MTGGRRGGFRGHGMTTRAPGTNLTGVHIPEEYGGQGLGFIELGLVLEEMGRALLCAPYFSTTVLAATRS